jgi:hypothetical protein
MRAEAEGQRDPGTGRFVKGNSGGPGNPQAAKVAKLRTAFLDAVTEEDVRDVLAALVAEARAGSVPAIREFLTRVMGQPQAVDAIERLAELEAALERLGGSSGGIRS